MRYYFVSHRVRTGGPESVHQMCDVLTRLGVEAYVHYYPNPDDNFDLLFPEYADVRVSEVLPDAHDAVIVVPEVLPIRECHFQRSMIAVWWLSFTNAALVNPGTMHANLIEDHGKAVHLFQSYFSYAMVRPFLGPGSRWFFLTDYIREESPPPDPAGFADDKQDLVCFNAAKDKISEQICTVAGISSVAIGGMTREQVVATLRRCKIYLDNGFHPGRDRLPREAALNGCVVITNRSGSAAFGEDVPIDEKVTMEAELYELIPEVLADYRRYFDKQQFYRESIRREQEMCEINARNFVDWVERFANDPDERERLWP